MEPAHVDYETLERFEIPDFITFKILLTGAQTGGTHAIFEDDVHPGQGGQHQILQLPLRERQARAMDWRTKAS